jgi:hypothetical protein
MCAHDSVGRDGVTRQAVAQLGQKRVAQRLRRGRRGTDDELLEFGVALLGGRRVRCRDESEQSQ